MKQKHKKHVFHLRRVSLFAVLIAAFFIVRFDAGSLPGNVSFSGKVLAYASEMSRSALLSGTNSSRSANGLSGLTLDSQLNSAAQMKAEDMAAKNYWAHTSPDGTEPWYFFQQAGYGYSRAGENLAYGFSSSQSTIQGWMNSPSHRANVLGDYVDVGFGIVNAPSYQNEGQQTIVVAHYGTRTNVSPPPALAQPTAPAPTTPAKPVAPSAPVSQQSAPDTSSPEPTNTPQGPPQNSGSAEAGSPVDSTEASPANKPVETAIKTPDAVAAVATGSTVKSSLINLFSNKSAPFPALVSMVLVSLAAIGYALTHRSAFQHAVTAGENYALTHPGIDAGVIAAITSLILLTTYGTVG